MRLSDLPTPSSVHSSQNQFAQRADRVVLFKAGRSIQLFGDFTKDAEGAMAVAMCKLELCRRDLAAGGPGDFDRYLQTDGTVKFFVGAAGHADEPTSVDPPSPMPIPGGWTLPSFRRQVIAAIGGWKPHNRIGTDLSMGVTAALMGGHYALLIAAWGLGIGVFVFLAALILGLGMEDVVASAVIFLAGLPGLAALMGAIYGVAKGVHCHQGGDHDMTMMGLFPIIYRYGALLNKESYDLILHELLRKHVSGGADKVHTVTHVCGKQLWLPFLPGETENHILMIETARFLTNQLLLLPNPHVSPPSTPPYIVDYDNAKNGMREWMLQYLQQFLQNDMWEFNSRIYARLVPVALQNLYEFSSDPDVSKAARMVLDYVSAKFAVSSNGSRRAAPFRRRSENRHATGLFDGKPAEKQCDPETWRFLVLTGDTHMLAHIPKEHEELALAFQSYTLVMAALGRYRVPELLLDLMLVKNMEQPGDQKKPNRFLQRIRHGEWNHGYGEPALEVTYSSVTYLITGGGVFAEGRQWPLSDDEREHAWALPTTLMPTASGVDVYGGQRNTDWKDFIRIEGASDEKKRGNTGVAPGFACGLNPVIPDWMLLPVDPQYVRRDMPPWTFINCASIECGRPFGFYVAVYRAGCDSELSRQLAGKDGTFGFFAVSEVVRPSYTFEQFVSDVIALNGSTTYTAEGMHTFSFPTGFGPNIEFVCLPTFSTLYDRYTWPIVKINGVAWERDIGKWHLAQSEVFDSKGSRTSLEDFVMWSEKHYGCVMVDNPRLDHRLILDMGDALQPKSAYVTSQRFESGCRCPLSGPCERLHSIK